MRTDFFGNKDEIRGVVMKRAESGNSSNAEANEFNCRAIAETGRVHVSLPGTGMGAYPGLSFGETWVMKVIEVQPVHGGWKVTDASADSGWITVFPSADGLELAIKYAKARQGPNQVEIRVLNPIGNVVDTIHVDYGQRGL